MENIFVVGLLIISSLNDFVISHPVADSNDTLVSVAVLFRHGDRAPKTSFPNDPYFSTTYWPMGFKQLTNQGKQRHYELGKWFRNRYDSFLPKIYSPDDIYVRSSDVDRTLMSAAANLAGLYPPVAAQQWTNELNWQPIPIHTLTKKKDFVISMKKKCKRYNKELEKVVASDFFVNTNTENAELYEYLSNQTGWDVDDISFVKDLQSIFYADREYNASFVPAWADTLDEDKINYLAGLAFARDTYNTKLKRLRIGPFFYFLLDHFDNVINEDEDTPKFLMLSGHESTVAAVLNGMDAFDYLTPEFASVVIWELKKSENGTHYINMFYKKENSLNSIVINNCYNDCQYEEFKALLEEITVSDSVWEDECGS